jgi:hypothetical protein
MTLQTAQVGQARVQAQRWAEAAGPAATQLLELQAMDTLPAALVQIYGRSPAVAQVSLEQLQLSSV